MSKFTAGQIERIREQWITREEYDFAETGKQSPKKKGKSYSAGHITSVPVFNWPNNAEFSWSQLAETERTVPELDSEMSDLDTEMEDSDWMDSEVEGSEMQIE
jgi:hypothetical protein